MTYDWRNKDLLTVLLLIIAVSRVHNEAQSVGQLSVQFISYTHLTDRKSDGTTCDSRSFCDPRFIFCLKHIINNNLCGIERLVGTPFSDTPYITFKKNSDIGFPNPVIHTFDVMPENIVMEIKIEDADRSWSTSYNTISTLSTNLKISEMISGTFQNIVMIDQLHNLTLHLRVTKTCFQNQYGITCAKRCLATSHGLCNSTGDLICNEDWIEENSQCVREKTFRNESNKKENAYYSSELEKKNFITHLSIGICGSVLFITFVVFISIVIFKRYRRQSDVSFLYLQDNPYKAPSQSDDKAMPLNQTNEVYFQIKSRPLPGLVKQQDLQISSAEEIYEQIEELSIQEQPEPYQSLSSNDQKQLVQGGRKFQRQH